MAVTTACSVAIMNASNSAISIGALIRPAPTDLKYLKATRRSVLPRIDTTFSAAASANNQRESKTKPFGIHHADCQ